MADMAADCLESPFSSVQMQRASSPLHTLSYLALRTSSAHCCLSSPVIWQQAEMAAFLPDMICWMLALCSSLNRENLRWNFLAILSLLDSDCRELQM
jgi:hypothetical protein